MFKFLFLLFFYFFIFFIIIIIIIVITLLLLFSVTGCIQIRIPMLTVTGFVFYDWKNRILKNSLPTKSSHDPWTWNETSQHSRAFQIELSFRRKFGSCLPTSQRINRILFNYFPVLLGKGPSVLVRKSPKVSRYIDPSKQTQLFPVFRGIRPWVKFLRNAKRVCRYISGTVHMHSERLYQEILYNAI